MEANAGKSFQMQILFNVFPHISLDCKLVPVQYWEYEYGLLLILLHANYLISDRIRASLRYLAVEWLFDDITNSLKFLDLEKLKDRT